MKATITIIELWGKPYIHGADSVCTDKDGFIKPFHGTMELYELPKGDFMAESLDGEYLQRYRGEISTGYFY